MNYNNLVKSFAQSAQYEAAGTIRMLDAILESHLDSITISQLQTAMGILSEEAIILSSTQPGNRLYSFDVPLPAKVVDVHVAERKEEGESIVVVAHTLPMLAWRALVIAWYGAISEAPEKNNED